MTTSILVLAANPNDNSRLRVDQEVRDIDNGLQRAKNREQFILKATLATQASDLRRAVLDFNPNIVHFCGHGSGVNGIALEDVNGNSALVSTEALSGFFQLFSDTVECVVLNACYSEVQAQAIAKHIKFVIGMREGIDDAAAIEFAVAFYDALGAGKTIDFAHKIACNAIAFAGLPGYLTPALIKHSETSQFPNKIYDSKTDADFSQWTVFSTAGDFPERIQLIRARDHMTAQFAIQSFGSESVGVNRSFPILHGRVEFSYRVPFSNAVQPNVFYCMIPMQETGIGRSGIIEVGTNVQDDPKNVHSLYRKRFYVPMEHFGDDGSHRASMSFDFRDTPSAFYCIFAPRINEGCSSPAAARLITEDIQIYSA